MKKPSIVLAMSVDTEEDNWGPTAATPGLANIRRLTRLHGFLTDLGVRATYFVNYPVVNDDDSVSILREIAASGGAEIGAHLHPWNTPPFDGPPDERPSMMLHLPEAAQAAKVGSVTGLLRERFGRAPKAFRAGRFGFGGVTGEVLVAAGYAVDSSVTPFISWEEYDHGPSFVGAPLNVYRLDFRDVRAGRPDGPLIEVPISAGFSRGAVGSWGAVYRLLQWRIAGRRVLASLASESGFVREVVLSPELCPLSDLLGLSRSIVASGAGFLHMFWHSPSLVPGLTPFTASAQDVDRVYRRIEEYVARLRALAEVRFATVSEAASLLAPPLAAAPEDTPRC